MRIVGGKYRGKKLISPKNYEMVRPTTDKVKESIFNILMGKIYDSIFLDLFSGSGAISCEAISRGARCVTCVDNDGNSLLTMKKNFDFLKEDKKKLKIEKKDAIAFLKQTNDIYDIIFADPYYNFKNIDKMLNIIEVRKLLKVNGILILETDKSRMIKIPEGLELVKSKVYSITKLSLIRRTNE